MVCINPDGSLGASASTILANLIQPASLDEIARNTNAPIHRIRPCLHELLQAGLVAENQGFYRITDIGLAMLNSR
jgi:predicted transcriptional regulator